MISISCFSTSSICVALCHLCMGFLCNQHMGLHLRKANQEKLEAEEQAENERIEQYARDKREREAGESGASCMLPAGANASFFPSQERLEKERQEQEKEKP